MNEIERMDVDPDGPGDLFVPYSRLRLRKIPAELRVTSKVYQSMTRTDEDLRLSGYGKSSAWVGACLWAIEELEREVLALRRGRSGGQS